MDIEKFEKDMAVFSFRQHQDVLTYFNHLKATGWAIEDAQNWIIKKQEEKAEQSAKAEKLLKERLATFPKCPNCQRPMWTLPVNTGPADQTGDDSKSVMLCTNRECMHTIYNKETVAKIIRKGEQ